MSYYTYILAKYDISDCKTFEDVKSKFPDARPAFLRKVVYLKGLRITEEGRLTKGTLKELNLVHRGSSNHRKRKEDYNMAELRSLQKIPTQSELKKRARMSEKQKAFIHVTSTPCARCEHLIRSNEKYSCIRNRVIPEYVSSVWATKCMVFKQKKAVTSDEWNIFPQTRTSTLPVEKMSPKPEKRVLSEWILEALGELPGQTLGEVCSLVHKRYGLSKERARDRLYYLQSIGRVSAVDLSLGSIVRKLYCLPEDKDRVKKQIETLSTGIVSFLERRLAVVTPELIEYSRDRVADVSIGEVRLVLNMLVCRGEAGRLPFLTSKNKIAYFYFLNKKRSMIEDYLDNLTRYLGKNKYANATLASRGLGVELNEASYFLRHLVYLGQLNVMVGGYISEYRRCIFIYYVPGYREVLEKRHKIEREREYIEHSATIFEFLVNQMSLENKTDVINDSCKVLQLCIEKGILRGRDLDKLAMGCFVLSLRKRNVSVSVAEVLRHLEILDVGGISEHDILTAEKVIAQELEMPLHHFPEHKHYIERFVNGLKLSNEEKRILMQTSLEVFSCVPQRFITGKRPSTLAAATIYAAVNILREIAKYGSPWITQTELSIVSGVTEVSIRNYYRIIEGFYKDSKGSV